MKKKKKIETRGRKPKAPEDKQRHRAICRLDAADKATLEEHAEKTRQSESAILRTGLVETGVLAPPSSE